MRKLLVKDPSARMSTGQALRHPFITGLVCLFVRMRMRVVICRRVLHWFLYPFKFDWEGRFRFTSIVTFPRNSNLHDMAICLRTHVALNAIYCPSHRQSLLWSKCPNLAKHVHLNSILSFIISSSILPTNAFSAVIPFARCSSVPLSLLSSFSVSLSLSQGVSTSLLSRTSQSLCCHIPPVPIIMGHRFNRYDKVMTRFLILQIDLHIVIANHSSSEHMMSCDCITYKIFNILLLNIILTNWTWWRSWAWIKSERCETGITWNHWTLFSPYYRTSKLPSYSPHKHPSEAFHGLSN